MSVESAEIPIWVNGEIRWLSGIDKRTTCKDIIEVLLGREGLNKSEAKDFTIMERWRKVERPIDENSKILRIWSHWGHEKKEVRLCLRRIDTEVDSGRGSPVNAGLIPSARRKRNRFRGNGKPPWTNSETLHPRRLAELTNLNKKEYVECHLKKTKPTDTTASDLFHQKVVYDAKQSAYQDICNNKDDVSGHKKSTQKSYHCPSTGRLHSTLLQHCTNSKSHPKRTKCCSKRESKHKARNSENIEKLMKLILVQGATIQSQLQKLKEREEQIELIEQAKHRERIEKNGRNYLLETYLGSLKDAEIPVEMEDERADDSGVNTEGGSDLINAKSKHNKTELKQDNKTEKQATYVREHWRQLNRGDVQRSRLSFRLQKKTARSKSESRTQEVDRVASLKRTLSDSSIATRKNSGKKCEDKSEESSAKLNAKEDSLGEVVELRKIQSQIEMWEKIFQINKKLEKEEENLVRLHIKIKKVQNENYGFAKDRTNEETIQESNGANSQKATVDSSGSEHNAYVEVRKSLETLKSDLEQNSKEIYRNFTQLLEDDEKVEQKRNCLTQLLTDLERSNHEQDMLKEMIAMRESKPVHVEEQQMPDVSESFHQLDKHGSNNPVQTSESSKYDYSNNVEAPRNSQNSLNQSTEADGVEINNNKPPTKPKIMKISFGDEIQSFEDGEMSQEKSQKEQRTSVPVGALKSILKNRNQSNLGKCNLYGLQRCNKSSQEYEQFNESKLHSNYRHGEFPNVKQSPAYGLPEQNNFITPSVNRILQEQQVYDSRSQIYCSSTMIPNNYEMQTAFTLNPNSHEITKSHTNIFPHATMAKVKVAVHNDTDSSTSSDTSGQYSMYSSSPTVEAEAYMEQGYILDTLV